MVSHLYGKTCADQGRAETSNVVTMGVALVYGAAYLAELDNLTTRVW